MLRCTFRGCVPAALVAGLMAGCGHSHRYAVPIKWQTIEPQHAGTAPDRLPEVLDYTRLPEAAVHFPDERGPADASEFPYRCIGQLLIYYADGTVAQCTAFLVGPAHILTVADGFVGRSGARAVEHAVFTPALSAGTKPFGSANVVRAAVPRHYEGQLDAAARDVAIALLDRPIGDEAGYLAFDYAAASEMTGKPVMTAGYARDTGPSQLVRAEGRIERYGYPGTWWHNLDAAPGQNGSPIWLIRDGEPVTVAIYRSSAKRHSHAVGAASADDDLLDAIRTWVRRNPFGD